MKKQKKEKGKGQKKVKPKVRKERPYPDKPLIKGALRRLMARSPAVKRVLQKAVHPTKKGPRGGKQFICAKCKETYGQKDINVDHKRPVIPVSKTLEDMDYNEIVQRIFCKESNLQVLCRDCHKEKTKDERNRRKRKKDTQKRTTKK